MFRCPFCKAGFVTEDDSVTQNEKVVDEMTGYDLRVVAEGLSLMTGRAVDGTAEDVLAVLDRLSEAYGGVGLASVMEYFINNRD